MQHLKSETKRSERARSNSSGPQIRRRKRAKSLTYLAQRRKADKPLPSLESKEQILNNTHTHTRKALLPTRPLARPLQSARGSHRQVLRYGPTHGPHGTAPPGAGGQCRPRFRPRRLTLARPRHQQQQQPLPHGGGRRVRHPRRAGDAAAASSSPTVSATETERPKGSTAQGPQGPPSPQNTARPDPGVPRARLSPRIPACRAQARPSLVLSSQDAPRQALFIYFFVPSKQCNHEALAVCVTTPSPHPAYSLFQISLWLKLPLVRSSSS